MTITRNILFHLSISIFAVCSLHGMDLPLSKDFVDTVKEYVNIPYLITKTAALFIEDSESSEESEDIDLENSLLQREIITIIIDSLKLGNLELTINSRPVLLKKICNARTLTNLLHLLYRDYNDPLNRHSFAQYVELVNQSLHWEALKSILESQAYDSLNTLIQKTDSSKFKTEDYCHFLKTLATAVGFPFDTEINENALSNLCQDLSEKRLPSTESIRACFTPTTQHSSPYNKWIRVFVGLISCISDYTKDKKIVYKKLLRLYASIDQKKTNYSSSTFL